MNNIPKIYFFTGASGAGKTKFLESLSKETLKTPSIFLNFDSIGVPSEDEMIKQYGSGSDWQKAMTFFWVKKMLSEYNDQQIILFEGQVNLVFIKEAFSKYNFVNYKIILVHCSNVVRHRRLSEYRMQPELINPEMDNWSDYLMKQAIEHEALILDTSNKSMNELIEWYKSNLDL